MMEKLERNVVSWEIQHTKVEFMAYVSQCYLKLYEQL